MRQIATIVRKADQGISNPFLCKDGNEIPWWCKGHLSGEQTQRYEWICACLAKQLSLPVPDFEIMEVPVDLFKLWSSIRQDCKDLFVTTANPYVFASRLVPNCRDLSPNSPFLDKGDRELQARIFVFDRIIRNTDRTDGNSNVLVNASEEDIRIIDHNLAFDPAFDDKTFLEGHIFRGAFRSLAPEERANLVEDVFQKVATFDLDAVWNEMPDPWTDEIGTGLTLDDVRGILFTRWSPLP